MVNNGVYYDTRLRHFTQVSVLTIVCFDLNYYIVMNNISFVIYWAMLFRAIGTRWVCSMWWFFAVIVCQTYIAQLSASMTSALEDEPINSVENLANQNKILYGALDGGSTLSFFKVQKSNWQNDVSRMQALSFIF